MDESGNELERAELPEPYPMYLGDLWVAAMEGREARILEVPERLVRLAKAAGDRGEVDRALLAALRGEVDLWLPCADGWAVEPDRLERPEEPVGRIAPLDVAALLRDGRAVVRDLELRTGWIRLEEGLEVTAKSFLVDPSVLADSEDGPDGATVPSPAATPASSPPTRILRVPDVLERTGLSRTTIWRLESRGDFPARRRLGPQAVGWAEDEVTAWLDDRAPAGPLGIDHGHP